MINQLISPSLSDQTEIDSNNKEVYSLDCHNINICKSYGEISFACIAGANSKTRCTLGEKMQIRILNDSNPNATFRPKKPVPPEEQDY